MFQVGGKGSSDRNNAVWIMSVGGCWLMENRLWEEGITEEEEECYQTVPIRVMIGPAVRTAFPDSVFDSFPSERSLFFLLPQIYEKMPKRHIVAEWNLLWCITLSHDAVFRRHMTWMVNMTHWCWFSHFINCILCLFWVKL